MMRKPHPRCAALRTCSVSRRTGPIAGQPPVPPTAPRRGPGVGEELAKLPLDLLQRGRYQPRMDMRAETLGELADSIKAQGVVQPIVVRPLDSPGDGVLAALRDHRRRAPLARRADGRPSATSRRSSATFPTRRPSRWR